MQLTNTPRRHCNIAVYPITYDELEIRCIRRRSPCLKSC
nr:MAG TPA: hypothetical protein [Caudoviricetes sp.]